MPNWEENKAQKYIFTILRITINAFKSSTQIDLLLTSSGLPLISPSMQYTQKATIAGLFNQGSNKSTILLINFTFKSWALEF